MTKTNAPARFHKTVPMPTTRAMSRSPIAFIEALLASRTLRTAVEQIRERGHGLPVYRDGSVYVTIHACVKEDGTTTPGDEFFGGKTWSLTDEKAVRRNTYKALCAWGFLVDEVVVSGGPCSVARAWFALAPDETIALASKLVSLTRSASKALDHHAWKWLGYSRRDVSRALYDAQSRGLCECYESGSIVELWFRGEDGVMRCAV